MSRPTDPVPFTTTGGVTAATLVWRRQGRLFTTVVAKASFDVVPGGTMRLRSADPVAREEVAKAGLGLTQADELAPFLQAADILVVGYARNAAAFRDGALQVRLGIFRKDSILLDKSWSAPARDAGERVWLSGLGPISKNWPVRRKLLGSVPLASVEGPAVDIPDGFDWRYFQAAPSDQRIPYLTGSEGILLDGIHETHARIQTALPPVRVAAMLFEGARAPQKLTLHADTCLVDVDRLVCHLVYRGCSPLSGNPKVARVEIAFGPAAAGGKEPLRKHLDPGKTQAHSVEEINALRAKFATPFDKLRGAMPKATPAAGSDLSSLRARQAMPFQQGVAKGLVPPQRGSLVVPKGPPSDSLNGPPTLTLPPVEADAQRGREATPFEKKSPSQPASAMPLPAPVAQRPGWDAKPGATMALPIGMAAALDADSAMPFEPAPETVPNPVVFAPRAAHPFQQSVALAPPPFTPPPFTPPPFTPTPVPPAPPGVGPRPPPPPALGQVAASFEPLAESLGQSFLLAMAELEAKR